MRVYNIKTTPAAPKFGGGASPRSARHPGSGWRLARRALAFAFIAAVMALIVWRARTIDWSQVADALRAYRGSTVFLAAVLAAASYLVYSCFELLGRAYTGHRLARARVMAIGFVSYAFNLNLGPWIGAIGMRYRLYARAGLRAGLITRVFALSVATNWSGYVCLGGLILLLRPMALPAEWAIGSGTLRTLGGLMLATVPAYLLLCAYAPRRSWTLRGVHVWLPPARIAVLQLLLASANWLLIASVLYVLLLQRVEFPTVAGVLILSAMAGVLVHIPAGLGVMEAVFLTLLGPLLPPGQILAALLAYRAIYYLGPLLLALVLYLALEARTRPVPPPAHHGPH